MKFLLLENVNIFIFTLLYVMYRIIFEARYIYIIFNFIKNSLKIFSNILRKLDPIEFFALPNNTFNSLNTDIINTFDGWKN